MTAVAPSATARQQAGPASATVAPMSAAADRLQHQLDRRWRLSPAGPRPTVTTLGVTDVTTTPDADRRDAVVHLTGGAVYLGPWGPGPGCGHCFGVRWQRLRGRTERDALETGQGLTAVGDWPELPSLVIDAVWQAYRTSRQTPPGTGLFLDQHSADLRRVTSVDLRSLCVITVPLLPEPQCPSCSVDEPTTPPEFGPLVPRPKPAPDSYRLHHVRDYPLPVGAMVNPVCGVIGSGALMNPALPTTAAVTGGIFVRGYAGLLDVSWSGHANSYADSLRLAYLEGLERYAGTHRRRPGPPIVATYTAVADRALDPTSCGVYADATYQVDPLVERFDADRPIPWVWGHVVRTGQPILVPRRLCFYSSGAPGDNFVLSSSNGCATGSCLEEAILYGMLELIERDAFVMGWYGRESLPGIDLESCSDPAIRTMVDRGTLSGYRVLAFDNRIDMSIPVVTTLAVRRDGGSGLLAFAAGAHLDPQKAVAAALSETLSYIPMKARATRRRREQLTAMAADHSLVQTVNDHADLYGLPSMRSHAADYLAERPRLTLTDLYGPGGDGDDDLLSDLQRVLTELEGRGLEPIVVDQTTPEQAAMGLRTVCTIVPGLLPIDFGWLRQRALTMPRLQERLRARSLDGPRLSPHPFP